VAALIAGAALFALVTVNVLLGQASFVEKDLEGRAHERRMQVERLEVSVAELRSPARIAARATKLGLVPADDVDVVVRDSRPG
jgi:cell division protein FtsL